MIMKNLLLLPYLAMAILAGCTNVSSESDLEQWKTEVAATEKAFNDMKNSGKKEEECWTVIGNILLNLDETVHQI